MSRWFAWSDRWLAPSGVAREIPESYGYLARRLESDLPRGERGRLVVLSAAASPSSGNDAILSLAGALREELGARILIVDGSFRRDGIGAALGRPRAVRPGDLNGAAAPSLDELAEPISTAGLFLLRAQCLDAAETSGAAASAAAPRLTALIGEARRTFDYVLLQQAAAHEDSRYLNFLKDADLILIVAEEGRTRMADLERRQRTLRGQGIASARILLIAQAT